MKFGVVIFPGSNCDRDTLYVIEHILQKEVVPLWHKDTDLKNCDFIILPGGFSYGDYLRSGAIAALSPVMKEVINFARNGGYVLGICNGFQVLCETGLLPGVLLPNESQKFVCRNILLKPSNNTSLLTRELDPDVPLKFPIAHADGRYYIPTEELKSLWENNQILFQYCDQDGNTSPEVNPNGSIDNIAGVCNKQNNVFGMMPHPERAADPVLGNTDGLEMFRSILAEKVQS